MIKIECNDFNLDESINCGQIFRFNKESDNSYTIPLSDRIINVKQENNILIVNSNDENNLEDIVKVLFDLDTDYNEFNKVLMETDNKLIPIIDKCKGFKIFRLNQFETIISYIISANNNVRNIKNSVDLLSIKYGEKVIWNSNEYYLFPTAHSLKSITIEELNSMKLGFRSKYVYEIINKTNSNEIDLNYIESIDTKEALEYLVKYKGIGLKVASCILLFGYGRYDVFPIDTWVKKTMTEFYGVNDMKSIQKIINEKYGKYSGIVIQYMFHYKRNK